MDQDTSAYDSLANRPLPRWLTNQRDGLNTIQPVKKEMKDDWSIVISLALTGLVIVIVIAILTIITLKRKKNRLL